MKIKKIGVVNEFVNSDNSLIGTNKMPETGSDLESLAGGTTDKNAKISRQPFRYDFLGRFGMFLYYEGENKETDNELLDELAKLMYEKYIEIIEYYYKNPNKLKNDYRKSVDQTFETQPQEKRDIDYEWAKKVVNIIRPYLEEAMEGIEQKIDEDVVTEDEVLSKKDKKWLDKKIDDGEISSIDVDKIGGLVNKVGREDVKKIINILEKK